MIKRSQLNPNGYVESQEVSLNLNVLLERLNALIDLGAPITSVTSGLRSDADQARINPAAPKSKHLIGAAADIFDPDGALHNWVLNNVLALKIHELWCEDTKYTSNWIHFQIFPPKSGNRFFIP